VTFYARRECFSRCSAAVGSALDRLPLTPNGWTILGLGAGLATALALAAGRPGLAGAVYLLAGFFDLADGAVARQRGNASKLGAYLDTLADRITDALALLGLLLLPLPRFGVAAHLWIFLYMFLSLMGTYAKAAAREKGLVEQEFRGGGILERPERVLILSAGLVAGSLNPLLLVYVLALLSVLAAVSLVQRVRLVLAEFSGRQGREGRP
jgi:phosphatidylglycerophosphate synthase